LSTQLQLIQAEKMESVGRLAAGVAHEVKNPLALLLMGVEYLSQGVDPSDPHLDGILGDMREAIDRADRIIRGLVDFSSERQLDIQPTDLPKLVEQVLLLVRHEVHRNQVQASVRAQADLPLVLLDSAKFEQVLVNLFINAIHAMEGCDQPQLEITVRTAVLSDVPRDLGARTKEHLRDGDAVVMLEVADNGTGISAENLQKVFDPFFTTKATGQGTGLGLSVVRKIIELHGGSVELRNRPDGGALVQITLRIARQAPSPLP
ncbi:MAG: ATP-binding protein, partial [Verrucomicrobiota bacterium]